MLRKNINWGVNINKVSIILIVAVVVILSGCTETSVQVTISNVHDEQPISPGLIVMHTSNGILDFEGGLIPAALEPLAEYGSNAQFAEYLRGQEGVEQVITFDEPILPGQSISLQVTPSLYSIVSVIGMAVGTNDGYVLVDSVDLSGTYNAKIYDAGTEENEGLLCGFDCGQPDPSKGESNIENGVSTSDVVKIHPDLKENVMTVTFT